MKFRFYIVSVFNGNIVGTNDEAIAKNFAGSSDDFVIDIDKNGWLQEDETVQIPEYQPKKKK